MKKLLLLFILLVGCERPIQQRDRISKLFGDSCEIYATNEEMSRWIVRDTSGAVWVVEMNGQNILKAKIFNSTKAEK